MTEDELAESSIGTEDELASRAGGTEDELAESSIRGVVPRAILEMTTPPRPGEELTSTDIARTFDELTYQRAKAIVDRYPRSRSALLPMLHLVQSVEGYVSQRGIAFCAEQLAISTAQVSAVATFYTMYKRRPGGEHLVSVCTNTLCAALGGDEIYQSVCSKLGSVDSNGGGKPLGHEQTVGEPGTTGSITVEHAECLAACDLAPVIQVNYEYFDRQSVESANELVAALRRGEKPHPTRGAPLTDWRTVERELAGFFDDLATASGGPSAATETLVGAALAESNGWTAPVMPEHAELPPVPEKK